MKSAVVVMVACGTLLAEVPRLEFLAVAINDVPIPPTNELRVTPGDIVELNAFLSNWSPNGEALRSWKFRWDFDRSSVQVAPFGWGSDRAGEGIFIDSSRPDYVYIGLPELPSVSTYLYRWWSSVFSMAHQPCQSDDCHADPCGAFPLIQCREDHGPDYLGSLVLEVLQHEDNCGEYVVTFSPDNTDLVDAASRRIGDVNENAMYDDGEIEYGHTTLIIQWEGSCGFEATSVPTSQPNCAIDARQPHEPGNTTPQGWRQLTAQTNCATGCESLNPRQITVSEGGDANLPVLGIDVEHQSVAVRLAQPVRLLTWTCAELVIGDGGIHCAAHVPGDVNNDGVTDTDDMTDLLTCTGGSCAMYRCDIDRSGKCSPADVLRWIDLAVGSEEYVEWLGEGLIGLGYCPGSN